MPKCGGGGWNGNSIKIMLQQMPKLLKNSYRDKSEVLSSSIPSPSWLISSSTSRRSRSTQVTVRYPTSASGHPAPEKSKWMGYILPPRGSPPNVGGCNYRVV